MAQDLTTSQLRAIKKAARLGRTLQGDMPEIAEDYRNGLSKPKIAEKHNVEGKYNVGPNIAQNAVSAALRGHHGHLGITAYSGLITDENELEKLAKEHQAIAFNSMSKDQRIAQGKRVHELGLGVHAYSMEERIKQGRKGGGVAKDKGLGFHAGTPKQKAKWQKNASVASGNVLYLPGEKERIHILAKDPTYQNGKRGPSYNAIAEQVNSEFHKGKSVRTKSAINYVLFRS